MRVIQTIKSGGALWLAADPGQASAANHASGTSRRSWKATRRRGASFVPMGKVSGRDLPPPDPSKMTAHRGSGTGVIAFGRNNIAYFNAPKIRAVRTLPKTMTGKMHKFVLRAKAHQMGSQP